MTNRDDDLDFTALDAPGAPAIAPAKRTAELEEEALIGERSLGSQGYHVVISRPRRAAAPGRRRVLVVEDDEDTAALVVRALANGGYSAYRAASSKEVSRLMATSGVPDLVLLDVNLPEGLSGFDMLARFRAHPRLGGLPIVLFTARGSRDDVIRGLTLGADGYVVKPVAPATLLEVVGRVVAG